jgi:hypothetical protein
MAKRLTLLLAALTVLAFVVAGCGGDGGDSDDADNAAGTMTAPAAEDGRAGGPANLEEAVDRCKQAAKRSTQLSATTRANLERICEKAGSGDENAASEAGRQICEQIVRDAVPAGAPGLQEGLDACTQGQ